MTPESNTRRRLLAAIVGATGVIGGCAPKRSDAEAVGAEFLERYIVRSDQASAAELSEGRAKTMLEKELDEVRSVRAAGGSRERLDEERPSYNLVERSDNDPGATQMMYEIVQGEVKSARIVMNLNRDESGNWSVSNFGFLPID